MLNFRGGSEYSFIFITKKPENNESRPTESIIRPAPSPSNTGRRINSWDAGSPKRWDGRWHF